MPSSMSTAPSTSIKPTTILWPQEGCDFPDDATRPETWWSDPTDMLNAWTTALIYLLSDFRYLHE